MRQLENFVDSLNLNEITKGGTYIQVSALVPTKKSKYLPVPWASMKLEAGKQ